MPRLRTLFPPYTPVSDGPTSATAPPPVSTRSLLRLAALLAAVAGVAAFSARTASLAGVHVVTADSGLALVNRRVDAIDAAQRRIDAKLDALVYMGCSTTRRVDPAGVASVCTALPPEPPGAP